MSYGGQFEVKLVLRSRSHVILCIDESDLNFSFKSQDFQGIRSLKVAHQFFYLLGLDKNWVYEF